MTARLAYVVALAGSLLLAGCGDRGADADRGPPRTPASTPAVLHNPVIASDFADPQVLRADDGYYAYATGVPGQSNLQVARSTDLARWKLLPDALPELPDWQPLSMGLTWAPEVAPVGDRWVMYYTAREEASGLQCISVAVASAPQGPFRDESEAPLVCQRRAGGSIDPHPFTDDDGRRYLFWKNDGNSRGLDTRIWVQPLAPDGLNLTGRATDTALRQTRPWHGALVEAPFVLRRDGTYLLFYSANDYGSGSYAMGYATARSVRGPYVDRSDEPWVATTGRAVGPGGQAVLELPSGELLLAFHAWRPDKVGYPVGGARGMWLRRLTVEAGRPSLAPLDGADEPPPSAHRRGIEERVA